MKLKGIKPIEQHFEKLIVVVLSAVFMLVLLMQFAVQPNMIEVGRMRERTRPGNAYGPVETRANQLKTEMTNPDPELPEFETVDIASDFRMALTQGVSPRETLAIGIDGQIIDVNPDVELGIARGGGTKYAEFIPPAPIDLVVGNVMNTLSPLDVATIPGLAELMPAQQPYDKSVITIQAVFNGAALNDSLRKDPDGEGEIMPYRTIWRNKLQILETRLEREELTETGEWTNLTVVQKLPGTLSLVEDIEATARSTMALEALAANAAQPLMMTRIRQPAYYAAMAGREWKSPVELAEEGESGFDQARYDVLLGRHKKAVEKLEKTKTDKEERERAMQTRMPGFEINIEKQEKALKELEDELRAMGHVFEGDSAEAPDDRRFGDPDETQKTLFDDEAIQIWAHDITAVPGRTYRYRIAVVMNNPLFGRQATIHANQHPLAEVPLAVGEMSEWTDPVEVDSMAYFFVTSASGGQGELASGAKATVDVFRFYYGFWRKGSTGLKPGDLIEAEVTNPENLYTFDFDAAPKNPMGEVLPAALEPLELDDDGNLTEPPEWFVPVETRMVAVVDAQFMDVSRIPGEAGGGIGGVSASRPKFQAVLDGGPFSRLFVRNPVDDKVSERYQRLTRSARLGETQGQPVVKQTQEKVINPWDQPIPGDPEGPGGGGGGG